MNIHRRLQEKGHLLLDGSMRTALRSLGLAPEDPPEAWTFSHPEEVEEVHRSFIWAGSDIILTNTAGANPFRLRSQGMDGGTLPTIRINEEAARIARSVADECVFHPERVMVAGCMGPVGEALAPRGTLPFGAVRAGFAAQAAGLAAGGADLLWIGSMADLREVRAAVEGARSVSVLPIVVTLFFEADGRTQTGVSPKAAVQELSPFDLAALGVSCGAGPEVVERVLRHLREAGAPLPLVAQGSNGNGNGTRGAFDEAGPELDEVRAHALRVRSLGARLIGGPYGTTPVHVEAMAEALRPLAPQRRGPGAWGSRSAPMRSRKGTAPLPCPSAPAPPILP